MEISRAYTNHHQKNPEDIDCWIEQLRILLEQMNQNRWEQEEQDIANLKTEKSS